MNGDCSELRDALARVDFEVLTECVLLQVALAPLILCGCGTRGSASRPIVAITYAFEAVFFLSMAFRRSRSRERALDHLMEAGTLCIRSRRRPKRMRRRIGSLSNSGDSQPKKSIRTVAHGA
jgi:hypothetical protein